MPREKQVPCRAVVDDRANWARAHMAIGSASLRPRQRIEPRSSKGSIECEQVDLPNHTNRSSGRVGDTATSRAKVNSFATLVSEPRVTLTWLNIRKQDNYSRMTEIGRLSDAMPREAWAILLFHAIGKPTSTHDIQGAMLAKIGSFACEFSQTSL